MAGGETRDLRPEIERIKERKDGLDVLHDLLAAARNGGFHSLSSDDLTLAKWWGVYPQRPEEDGYLMLRVRVPNGAVTSEQLRAIGDLSVRFGRSTGDVTTRQCLQLHWLRVEDLPEIFDTLDRIGLTSAQACGDVWRNVVGCPLAGATADEFFDSRPIVDELSTHFVGNRRFSNLPAQVQGLGLLVPPPLRPARDQRHRPRRHRRSRARRTATTCGSAAASAPRRAWAGASASSRRWTT